MSGEMNLSELLKTMNPIVCDGIYVFCSLSQPVFESSRIQPKMQFFEDEGVTVIILKEEAITLGVEFSAPSRMITLTVHSSLDAIGFLAEITTRLAREKISVNVVSAFYHDHLFVPVNHADRALEILTHAQGGSNQ